jgi:hypothetical protein
MDRVFAKKVRLVLAFCEVGHVAALYRAKGTSGLVFPSLALGSLLFPKQQIKISWI